MDERMGTDRHTRMIRIELYDDVWDIALHYDGTRSPLAMALLAKITSMPLDTQLASARRAVVCSVHEAQALLSIFRAAANVHALRSDRHRLRLAGDGCRLVINALRPPRP